MLSRSKHYLCLSFLFATCSLALPEASSAEKGGASADYDLIRQLVIQAQDKLEQLEMLAEEYERFEQLQERLASSAKQQSLDHAVAECALQMSQIIERCGLRQLLSPQLIAQLDQLALRPQPTAATPPCHCGHSHGAQ